MKLFDGTGFLIHKTHPIVITAYIRGAERLPFSRPPGLKRWFPRLSVHFSPAKAAPEQPGIKPIVARARLMAGLRTEMTTQRFLAEMEFGPTTLPEAILEIARERPDQVILQDATLQKLAYSRLRLGAGLLARQWLRLLSPGEQRAGV